MKIKTFGAKHFTGQLPRIEEGFRELGHEIVEGEGSADLVYANDPGGFDAAIEYLGPRSDLPLVIFNIQDIPRHLLPNYDFDKLKKQLSRANRVTSISETTQKDVLEFLDISTSVIYQPVMPVFRKDEKLYEYDYMICGRNCDPNKRNGLAFDFISKYHTDAKIAVVGSEYCQFGDYFGVVSNEVLNDLYNSTLFVLCLTKYGGIELTGIEAILAGAFPIVCNDSPVAMEFNPEFATEPTAKGIKEKILDIGEYVETYFEIAKTKRIDFEKKFSKVEVAKRILELM